MNAKTQAAALATPAAAGASRHVYQDADRAGDSLLCALLGVYLTSLMLEGVLRYALAMSGMPNALYLRDAIPVATLVVLFLRPLMGRGRIDLAIAIPVAILAFHAAYSAMAGVALFSIAFGLKIFMFIPYGMAMWPLVRRRFDLALTVAFVMFAVTSAGVFANFFLKTMPWEGLEYETAFGEVSTTRMWWMADGISRLPGFARTSFNAAMILGITGLLTLVKFRGPLARLAIAASAMAAIVLTTSKGMVLGFPLAALWVVVQQRKPSMSGAGLVGAVCAATLGLPLLIVYFGLGSGMSASSFPTLLISVWDRFTTMWPLAFELLPDGPQALLGAGLGSIGTPQVYGDAAQRFNAADNFAVFMLINFGLPGLFYYALPALSLHRVAATETATVHRAYVGLLLIAYGYGMSINMAEESFFSVMFGLCCAAATSAWLQPVRR
jgi:hypothetical protein